jgi:hypothetical protein
MSPRRAALEVYISKQRRLAGGAERDLNAARQRLAEAEDFFASGDYSNATLGEVARAAERIKREARRLIAVNRLVTAEAQLREMERA